MLKKSPKKLLEKLLQKSLMGESIGFSACHLRATVEILLPMQTKMFEKAPSSSDLATRVLTRVLAQWNIEKCEN